MKNGIVVIEDFTYVFSPLPKLSIDFEVFTKTSEWKCKIEPTTHPNITCPIILNLAAKPFLFFLKTLI